MSFNDQLLRIGRNYAYAAAATSIATAGTLISASNSVRYAASPASIADFAGTADFVLIQNVSTNRSYWHTGNSTTAPATNTAGGVICPAASSADIPGTLWLPLESEGIAMVRGFAAGAASNHVINFFQSERR